MASCLKYMLLLTGIMCLLPGKLRSQLQVTGQVSAAYAQTSRDSLSQDVLNSGRGTALSRLDLFGDATVSENISFHSAFRILQDQVIHIDQACLELDDVTPLNLVMEAGVIDLPFGDLGDDRYPMKNPFLHLPLMNEHYTSLRRSDDQLWPYDSQYSSAGDGVRLLDYGLYDIGVKVSGSLGILDISAACINGSVPLSGTYWGGLSRGPAPGLVARVAVTPDPAFSAGLSVSKGYLTGSSSSYGSASPADQASYRVYCYEGDIRYTAGHLSMSALGVLSRWDFRDRYGVYLKAAGYSVEAQYVFLPRWSAAVRAGGIVFEPVSILMSGTEYLPVWFNGPWDDSLVRIEIALGYRVDRSVLVKVVYERTSTTQLSPETAVPLGAAQIVLAF